MYDDDLSGRKKSELIHQKYVNGNKMKKFRDASRTKILRNVNITKVFFCHQ